MCHSVIWFFVGGKNFKSMSMFDEEVDVDEKGKLSGG